MHRPADPHRRRFLGGAALAGLLAAPRVAQAEDDPCPTALQTAQAQLDRLRSEHDAAVAARATAERRWAMATGAAPFAPETLTRGAGEALALPKATRVTGPEHAGEKAALAPIVRSERATVVVLWATWCKPCTSPEELAHVRDLAQRLSARRASLVSLSVDPLATVRADPRAATWVYPYWQLEDAHIELLPRSFIERRGLGLPLTLVLDAGGAIRWVRDGALTAESVAELTVACTLV